MTDRKANTHRHLRLKANRTGRDFVCGDLHGCYEELMKHLAQVKFNFDQDRLLALGDLIDRGENSLSCLRLLEKKWFHSILGNHEQMMMDFLFHQKNKYFWYINGGVWHSALCPADKREVIRLCQTYVCKLPHSITLILERGVKVGLVHADPPDDWEDLIKGDAPFESLIWGRDRINQQTETPVKNVDLVLVGHSANEEIRQLGNVIYLDTGAGYSRGKLTVIELLTFVEETFDK